MMQEPARKEVRKEETRPKQWNSGRGATRVSVGCIGRRGIRKRALLMRLWWERRHAFGVEVVPDVNWRLRVEVCWTSDSRLVSWLAEIVVPDLKKTS